MEAAMQEISKVEKGVVLFLLFAILCCGCGWMCYKRQFQTKARNENRLWLGVQRLSDSMYALFHVSLLPVQHVQADVRKSSKFVLGVVWGAVTAIASSLFLSSFSSSAARRWLSPSHCKPWIQARAVIKGLQTFRALSALSWSIVRVVCSNSSGGNETTKARKWRSGRSFVSILPFQLYLWWCSWGRYLLQLVGHVRQY
jgi:hypothetical protein